MGLVFSLLVATVSVASCFSGIGYVRPSFDVRVLGGVATYESPSFLGASGHGVGFHLFDGMIVTMGESLLPSWCRLPAVSEGCVDLPLGPFFASVACVTVIAFRRDGRWRPPGHCQKCGYDLTGNESGRCSECGADTPSPLEARD